MGYELRVVTSPEDWRAMHDIRRAELFGPGRHGDDFVYDENHPADRDPANVPYVLVLDGVPIGVTRLDRRGTLGVVRLVAIIRDKQREGHGRVLSELVEAEARRFGITRLQVNAHPNAVGYYERTGWKREEWDPAELVGIAAGGVQMVKGI
jgi:GNAT superfamily N-acetyltransferase